MDADRIERLVTQVLEETRAFRQETNERFVALEGTFTALDTRVSSIDMRVSSIDMRVSSIDMRVSSIDTRVSSIDTRVSSIEQDMTLMKLATIQNSREIAELRSNVQRIEGKLDTVIAEHGARLGKLEGAAE